MTSTLTPRRALVEVAVFCHVGPASEQGHAMERKAAGWTDGGMRREQAVDESQSMTTSRAYGREEERFAVILGATSIVGRYLARRLADGGFEGWCISRRADPTAYEPPPGFRWRGLQEDTLASAPAHSTWFSLIPIPALPSLVASGIRQGTRLIALSTSSTRFKTESSDPQERRLMEEVGRSEEEIRKVCEERATAWTVFRPTLVYDPGRDRNVTMIATVVRRLGVFPIVWPGLGGRQPIHADDVAQAMIAALGAPGARNRLLDLPGGETLTYREMVRAVFRSLGKRPILIYMPLGLARFAFRAWRAASGAGYSVASLERMNASLILDPGPVREVLGITCRPFQPEFPASPASPDPGRTSATATDESGG